MVVYNSCELENLPCMSYHRSPPSIPYTNLPVIDDAVTAHELQAVELLIRNERATQVHNTTQEHPMVSQILPLRHSFDSSLMRDIEQYESENSPIQEPQGHILPQTITMDRYTEFGGDNDRDYDRVYTTLSYSAMRERSASLMAQNQHHLENSQQTHLQELELLAQSYYHQAERKRVRAEDLNEIRKKRQYDFEPVNTYLEHRFEEGVGSMIDVGIERTLDQN